MEATTDQIATVAALNDIARRTMGVTCRTVITQGIAALDENTQSDILKMIEGFEDFTPDNDPHGEHDAGFLYRDVIGPCGSSTITTAILNLAAPNRGIPMPQLACSPFS